MKGASKGFPWATLIVNLAGCLLIGMFWGYFSRVSAETSRMAMFLTVGVCGGFTTFSTFSKEALMLLQAGYYWTFAAYIGISLAAGIALAALGYCLLR